MSVELDPPELGFRRPFTHEVTQVLRLRNPTSDPIAFKVKTTAPKQYCVRPNSGRIEPGSDVEIQVLLQAMKEDPPLDARCRDKFLVQSVAIAAEQDVGSVAAIWQSIEKISKDLIKERKIRVTFLPSHESTPQQNNVNGTHLNEAPPAYRSPSPSLNSPSQDAVTPRDKSADTPVRDNRDSTVPSFSNPSEILSAASATVSNAGSKTAQTLQQQLDTAKATIAQLRSQISDQGLRQRKSEAVSEEPKERSTTGATGMAVQTQPADGVPVQIVAALCLLSFLLAYFFF